jgi:hypothetical protein
MRFSLQSQSANQQQGSQQTWEVQLEVLVHICQCAYLEEGRLINQLEGVDLSALNGMNDAIAQMNAFDAAAIQTAVDTALTGLQDKIDKYYYTDEFDFSSSYDKNFMAKIANPARYSSCTVSSFQTDSWVPSIRQTDINCPSAISGTTATDTDCSNSGVIQARSGTCQGCMDTTKIIDNTGTFVADITARYSGCRVLSLYR